MTARSATLRSVGYLGAIIGYGCLAAFVYLLSVQLYRWFRDGEWTHIGVIEGMRSGVQHCCLRDATTGHVATLMQWLDSPMDWIGLHRVFELVPASLALFALSIGGNAVFIYCKDRWEGR